MKKGIGVLVLFIAVNFLIGQSTALEIGLEQLMYDIGIPGMSVAVAQEGEIVYSKAIGYADIKKKQKVNSETKFRMASVSKLFASAAIAKLMDEGRVFLDDPIEKYLKTFPHKGKGVTIRSVLNHTSGVRHYGKGDRFIDMRNYKTTNDALSIFMNDDLLYEPGTTYKYSTHAFTLLAAVVENVSGMTYTDYLEAEFFKPLNMSRSGPDVKGAKDDNQSTLYNGMKKSKFEDNPSYKRAGGGMLSTAEDLVRFGSAHMKAGFYQQSTLDALFEPSFEMPSTLNPTELAMAWRVSKDSRGDTIYHHAGNMNGARSFLMLSPKDGTVVAIMTNNSKLDFIDHVALAIRDFASTTKEDFPKKCEFGEDCKIEIENEGPYYTATLDIPEIFEESKKINLIANDGKDGVVLKNLEVEETILYLELRKKELIIYYKNSEGEWERKDFHSR